jgi:hypothetical protein
MNSTAWKVRGLTRCCVCSDYNECVHRVGDYKSGEEEEEEEEETDDDDDDDDHESLE